MEMHFAGLPLGLASHLLFDHPKSVVIWGATEALAVVVHSCLRQLALGIAGDDERSSFIFGREVNAAASNGKLRSSGESNDAYFTW